ncbi:MAG: hypothetical protein ACM3NT_02995 [Methylocystaceae bacterium]
MDKLHLECTIEIGQWYEDWFGRYFRVYNLEPASDPWKSNVHIIFTNNLGEDVPRKEPHIMEARQVAGQCQLQGMLSRT